MALKIPVESILRQFDWIVSEMQEAGYDVLAVILRSEDTCLWTNLSGTQEQQDTKAKQMLKDLNEDLKLRKTLRSAKAK